MEETTQMQRIAVIWSYREILFLAYLPQRFPAAAPFTRRRRTAEVLKQTSVSRGYTIPEPGAGDYAKTGGSADLRQITAQACCILFWDEFWPTPFTGSHRRGRQVADATAVSPRCRGADTPRCAEIKSSSNAACYFQLPLVHPGWFLKFEFPIRVSAWP